MTPTVHFSPEGRDPESLAGNVASYLDIPITQAREKVPQLLAEHRLRVRDRGRCPGCAVCETLEVQDD